MIFIFRLLVVAICCYFVWTTDIGLRVMVILLLIVAEIKDQVTIRRLKVSESEGVLNVYLPDRQKDD